MMDAYIHVVFVGSTGVDNFMSLLSKNIFRTNILGWSFMF